jgi:hypothetical protein
MKSKNLFTLFFITGMMPAVFMQCGNKPEVQEDMGYTHADSITEVYLMLQDSLHDTWNMMLSDDNEKIKAMKGLVHEMRIGTQFTPEKFAALDERIDQLLKIRYTPKTMSNTDVVEEYDFASNSLVTELISMAESLSSFSYNTTIQKLVEEIRSSDLRVDNYRADYDSVAIVYNKFIEQHATSIKEITNTDTVMKKAMFSLDAE